MKIAIVDVKTEETRILEFSDSEYEEYLAEKENEIKSKLTPEQIKQLEEQKMSNQAKAHDASLVKLAKESAHQTANDKLAALGLTPEEIAAITA
jgi:hypothetical protein